MAVVRRFLLRVLSLFRSTRAEHELAREIQAHLRLLEDQFLAKGMSAADARRAATRAFGGVEQAKSTSATRGRSDGSPDGRWT